MSYEYRSRISPWCRHEVAAFLDENNIEFNDREELGKAHNTLILIFQSEGDAVWYELTGFDLKTSQHPMNFDQLDNYMKNKYQIQEEIAKDPVAQMDEIALADIIEQLKEDNK